MNSSAPGPDGTDTAPRVLRGLDSILTVQRPVVLAYVRHVRSRHPSASPEQLIRMLERRYLAAATSGGALVGASAAIPGIGVGASVALSGVETVTFLETSALFAQSVTEVHGIAVTDPERAKAIVMTMILGDAGTELIRQFAAQALGGGAVRSSHWGELIGAQLPRAVVGRITEQMKRVFVRRFAATQGTSIVGRAIPYGIGAVIGGTGSHLLGRKIVESSRTAFPGPPSEFPEPLAVVIHVRRGRVRALPARVLRTPRRMFTRRREPPTAP